MAGKQRHTVIKSRIAGSRGKKEVPIVGGRRLDIRTSHTAIEIERSGSPKRISQALSRLKTQRNMKKELRVPHYDLGKARAIATNKKMNVVIRNLSGTKKRTVKK